MPTIEPHTLIVFSTLIMYHVNHVHDKLYMVYKVNCHVYNILHVEQFFLFMYIGNWHEIVFPHKGSE